MVLTLRLDYNTPYGQDLYVVVNEPKLKAYPMSYVGDGQWVAQLKLSALEHLTYHYEVRHQDSLIRREWGGEHHITFDKKAY